jgi:Tol biopolymer transport system component
MDGSGTKHFNYDLFVYRSGEIIRLTKMESYIFDASISADGSRAVFLAGNPREVEPSLWIVNTEGTGLKKIEIPWEQLEQPKDGAGGRSK